MSLVQLANACSHLQNASKARLGLTSVPDTKFHLKLMLALQNSGFISTVVRGGPTPPPAHQLLSHPSSTDPSAPIEPVTRHNIASRRLWVGLKYWNSTRVLEEMQLISKPTRRIWMDVEGIKDLVLGKRHGYVKGLTRPGECLYVSTDRGIMESRECVEKKAGGLRQLNKSAGFCMSKGSGNGSASFDPQDSRPARISVKKEPGCHKHDIKDDCHTWLLTFGFCFFGRSYVLSSTGASTSTSKRIKSERGKGMGMKPAP